MSEGNGDVQYDDIVIDGTNFKVRKEVSDEVVNLRREAVGAYIEKTKSIKPPSDHTIIVTVPGGTSQEFQRQLAELLKLQFVDHQIAVMPEGLGLHTEQGLRELLQAGQAMVAKIDANPDGMGAEMVAAAEEWNRIITGREESDGADQSDNDAESR